MKPSAPWLVAALAITMAGAVLRAHPSPEHRLEEIEEHLRDNSADPAMRISYAAQLRKMERFDEADKALNTVDLIAPGLPAARLERAQIAYARHEDVEVAESLGKALVTEHPRFAEGWGFLAQLQRKAEKTDEAIDSFRRYIALTSEYRAGDFTDLATLLSKRNEPGDKEEAIQVLDQGVAKVGDLTGLHLMAADLEVSLKRHEAAARRFDKLAARFRPRPDWAKRKGDIYLDAGRYGEASQAYDSAIAIIQAMPKQRREGAEVKKMVVTLTAARNSAAEKAGTP